MQGFMPTITSFHVTFIKNKDLLYFTLCFKYDFITGAHVVDGNIHISRHMMDSPLFNLYYTEINKHTRY